MLLQCTACFTERRDTETTFLENARKKANRVTNGRFAGHADFYQGGGTDIAFLGMAEVLPARDVMLCMVTSGCVFAGPACCYRHVRVVIYSTLRTQGDILAGCILLQSTVACGCWLLGRLDQLSCPT